MMEDPDATICEPLDVNDILRKYGISSSPTSETKQIQSLPTSPKINNKKTRLQVYNLSDSDSDLSGYESKSPTMQRKPSTSTMKEASVTTNKKTKSPNNKTDLAHKALLALEKAKKKQDAETKKLETAKNKEIKKMLSEANKQLKPDECLKFITAIVDDNISNITGIDTIIQSCFIELGSNYKIHTQIFKNTVTWTRKVISHQIDNSGTLKPVEIVEESPDLLLILTAEELFNLVKGAKLVEHIKTLESIHFNKLISLGVLELDKQVKKLRNNKSLSCMDVMTAVTEVQLFCNCCYRNLDGITDLVTLICQFTKAIGQRPYKLQQQEKYAATSWYMKGDNKDCVKVDKKGNGLRRLWQQQITTFPLARLETAESIIEKYPTVNSLMKEYTFRSNKEKETLLADIVVRRNAELISSNRRVGIEMSKKFNVFYNSLDGDSTIS